MPSSRGSPAPRGAQQRARSAEGDSVMNRRLRDRLLVGSVLVLALVACAPGSADEGPARRRHPRYEGCWLPPERHVIEVVRYGYIYIINGFRFTAPGPSK